MTWNSDASRRLYSIARWSEGYFDIDAQGRVVVMPQRTPGAAVALSDILSRCSEMGFSPPLLLCFPQILSDRVAALQGAFARAISALDYTGGYCPVFPIKVNQSASLVQQLLSDKSLGLEAGSKAELLAVLACSTSGGMVICNGYKDEEYVRLALLGQQLGSRVYLVIEKLSELQLILRVAAAQSIRPRLGIRLRLAAIADGKWQNSGGEKAKFGLTPGQVLEVVDTLAATESLDCLELLHFHLGSQISNIGDIESGVGEMGAYLAALTDRGVDLKVIDVGGGLGVDYEGGASRSFFSMNYRLDQYAETIVRVLKHTCDRHAIRPPEIVSESGRALCAHHAVLITEVIAVDRTGEGGPGYAPMAGAPAVVRSIQELLDVTDVRTPDLLLRDAQQYFAQGKRMFAQGALSLPHRAELEAAYYRVCRRVREDMRFTNPGDSTHSDTLSDILADKYFCNFSVFRSVPDVWAIDQIFPIMPLQRLQEEPSRRACLEDLTCDSDGRIDFYVDQAAITGTLALHAISPDEIYPIGVFLVGAYQEILGDNHNLFGLTHAFQVVVENMGFEVATTRVGDAAWQVLAGVDFQRDWLMARFEQRVTEVLPTPEQASALAVVNQSLDTYTYLRRHAPRDSNAP